MNSIPAPLQNLRLAAQAVCLRSLLFVSCLLVPASAFGAFGYTDNGTAYVVDTGAGLVFQVRKTDGTITSIVFNGTEYNGPSGKGSHIASGLGTPTTVSPETDGSTYVKITLQTDPSNGVAASLTHYLVVRNGDNTIYMATYPTAEPGVGELRWITRLDPSVIPDGPAPSDLSGNTGAIESTDIFGMADGTTRSKYYGDNLTRGKDRAMDLTYCGATGPGIGCWMVFGNRESSSGGPFFRDIENQQGGDQEIYNYMNSGHNQTEANRLNVLHGPYALVFTTGVSPTLPIDFSWMGGLGLTGWVPASGRGAVSGTATGIPAGFQGVMGFANTSAQYWATVAGDGTYTCSGVKPGTYTATLYKGELQVATGSVTVTAGTTTPLNLTSAEPKPSVIFRIGDWDGTPAGLLNANNITQMHPSDVRNANWGPLTYTVGVNDPSSFPAAQFRAANSPTTIKFNLTANQIVNLTARIGITCSYQKGGARPQVSVNAFTAVVPGTSTQPDSRSITLGTYRGNNVLYTYAIPSSALLVGKNTMTITPASGSPDSGTWLSASWAYDAVELDGPIAAPVITYVGGSPLVINGTAEPLKQIALTLDGSTPAGSAVASASGTWSITFGGPLTPGLHNFTAVASDDNGNSGPASAPFAIDTSIAVPVITAAVGDTGTYASGATTSDRVFVLNGTAGVGNTVTLTRLGVGNIGTVTADGSGNWSFDYTAVSLPDGVNSFYATASTGGVNSPSSPVFTLNLLGQPRIAIVRYNPPQEVIPNTIGSVVFRMVFNTTVNGVTTGAFDIATSGTAAGTVAGVSASSGTVFDVTVGGVSGTGTLKLILKPANGITDTGGNPEAGYTAGQSYTLVVPTLGSGAWIQPVSGGLWSQPVNWLNAVVADGSTNSANFATLDLTASNTVHLDSAHTINSLAFGDIDPTTPASWILDDNGAGNTLTLAGTTPTITVSALGTGATVTIGAGLAGTGGLTKAGAGTLVLTSANTLTGNTTVSAGTLRIAPGGSSSANNVSIAVGGAQLNIAGGTFSAAGTLTVNAGSGSALVVDSGTATFNALATSNTAGGLLRINGGNVTAVSVNLPRSSDGTPSFAAGFIVTGGTTTVTGTIGLGTNNSWGSMSVEGGALAVNGPITLGNQASGGRGGQMRVINNAVFTSTDTALGILMCRNNGTNANNVATATFTGGTSTVEKFTLGFDSTVIAGSATITLNGGTLYLGSGGIVKNGAAGLTTNLNFSSGTLGAKADWSTTLPINLPNGGNVAFQAADALGNPFAITLNGVLGGTGGFTKSGDGTLTLGAANTFTGSVNLNAGVLRVLGSLGSGGAVNLNGGTLVGTGTINKPVVLNTATIAPDGTSSFTFGGASLTWNGGGRLAIGLGANGVSGQLTLAGALLKGTAGAYEIAFVPGAGFAAGNTYTIATFGSTTFSAGDFVATGLPPGYVAIFSVTGTSLQVTIKAVATVTLTDLTQAYDGTPKTPTATTNPAGLNVVFTYNGDPTAPTLPGSYDVVATIVDPVYTGSASGTFVITITALIRHAPTLNGDIDGSAQVLLPENVTLNSAMVSGDLLVPGTPTVRLNGHPTYGSTLDGSGDAAPTNYTVTLNGNAVLRHVIRRTDPLAMPTVQPPPAPTGNRVVTLNNANQSVGDFTTLRDLTLNGNVGAVAVPPGTYGAFTANGNNGFILGVVGATDPAVYNLQSLVLNGTAQLQIVGPVTLRLAGGFNINGGTVGTAAHPDWLVLQIASGGLTLNGSATLHGEVTAPNGTVIINGNATLHGNAAADRLTINGNGVLTEVFP
jgi:rhamnogalacturonan endolyase